MIINEKMINKELIDKLKNILPADNIKVNESMARRTSYKCGGCAALFLLIDTVEELLLVLALLKEEHILYMVIGNGSNTLFKDSGYSGVCIKLGKDFSEINFDGDSFNVGAGVSLPYLSKVAFEYSYTGLEFACGIPGLIGGAILMNAGAYDACISDVIVNVTAINSDLEIYEYEKNELDFSYRHSRFSDSDEIILFAKLKLSKGNKEEIGLKMEELTKKRKEKQPLDYPSCGSYFKRPKDGFAAKLIEDAGLKGYSIGGAEVSSKHSGFIINKGSASASDILMLGDFVSKRVFEKYGIRLEREVRVIGD